MSVASSRFPLLAAALPLLAMLAAGAALGCSPIFIRLSDLAPIVSGFARLALALPFLLLLDSSRSSPIDNKPMDARDKGLLLACGLTFGADIAVWHLAIANTSVTDAVLLSNLTPVLVTIAAFFMFGERIRPLFIVGLVVALAGVAVLALQKNTGAVAPNPVLGNVLAVAAAACYAAYMLILGMLRKRHSTSRIMFSSTVISALSLLPFAVFSGYPLLPASLAGWLVIFAMSLISHVGGQGFFTYALAHLPTSLTAMTQFLSTAVAAVVAWIVLGEALTMTTLVCGGAILIGIFICRRASVVPV